jgi:thiamine kinase-like enzyme
MPWFSGVLCSVLMVLPKNMLDQWARRGVKRPFSSEDDLATSPTNSIANRNMMNLSTMSQDDETGNSPQWASVHQQLSNKMQLSKGKRGDRLGLGDQLLQLLHHWGQKRSGFQQQCLACACTNIRVSST